MAQYSVPQLRIPCDACGAEANEPCRVDCIGAANDFDHAAAATELKGCDAEILAIFVRSLILLKPDMSEA